MDYFSYIGFLVQRAKALNGFPKKLGIGSSTKAGQ